MNELEILQKANNELQSRIIQKNKRIEQLISEVSKVNLTNGNLLKEIKGLRDQVKALKGKKVRVNENPNTVKNVETLFRVRQKKIYGMLKNKLRYKVNEVEDNFLRTIYNCQTLSAKQFEWYNKIYQRGLIKETT